MATGIGAQPGPAPEPVTTSAPPSPGLEASLADLRHTIDEGLTRTLLLWRVIELVLRRPAGRPTRGWLLGAGTLTVVLYLLAPAAVTTVAGAWGDAPLWSWALIAVVFAGDAVFTLALDYPHTSRLDDFFSLTGRLDREEDARRLARVARRWLRLPIRVAVSIILVLPILAVALVADPRGVAGIHVGSVAMLLVVLYGFSEQVFFGFLVTTVFLRSESRYPHRLSWLSPADTPSIPRTLHAWGGIAVVGAVTVLIGMLPVALLVAPGTDTFLIALVGAMTLSGYVVTIACYLSVRSSVRTVVRRHRQQTLEGLQRWIDEFAPRLGDLTPPEFGRLQSLMATYAAVRDAPLTPRSSEAGSHVLTALAVPGIGFFLAVLAEVYAERLLTALVP